VARVASPVDAQYVSELLGPRLEPSPPFPKKFGPSVPGRVSGQLPPRPRVGETDRTRKSLILDGRLARAEGVAGPLPCTGALGPGACGGKEPMLGRCHCIGCGPSASEVPAWGVAPGDARVADVVTEGTLVGKDAPGCGSEDSPSVPLKAAGAPEYGPEPLAAQFALGKAEEEAPGREEALGQVSEALLPEPGRAAGSPGCGPDPRSPLRKAPREPRNGSPRQRRLYQGSPQKSSDE